MLTIGHVPVAPFFSNPLMHTLGTELQAILADFSTRLEVNIGLGLNPNGTQANKPTLYLNIPRASTDS